MRRVVGVADLAISNSADDVLITYSLGSCIAVIIYDASARVGGLLHYMLPESSLDPEKARTNPTMFADTGIILLFKQSYKLGARKENIVLKRLGERRFLIKTVSLISENETILPCARYFGETM